MTIFYKYNYILCKRCFVSLVGVYQTLEVCFVYSSPSSYFRNYWVLRNFNVYLVIKTNGNYVLGFIFPLDYLHLSTKKWTVYCTCDGIYIFITYCRIQLVVRFITFIYFNRLVLNNEIRNIISLLFTMYSNLLHSKYVKFILYLEENVLSSIIHFNLYLNKSLDLLMEKTFNNHSIFMHKQQQLRAI